MPTAVRGSGMPGGGREARKAEREAREAERKKQRKGVADAEKTLQKLQEATTVEVLTEAVRSGVQLTSYLPALDKALPEAQIRLRKMREAAEKSGLDDFMTRVEEAEKRDTAERLRSGSAGGNPMAMLESYFAELFQDADGDKNGTMDFDEFRQAISIIAPSFKENDLKAAWTAADEDRSDTIDRQEFMKHAPQYQLLGERMGRSPVMCRSPVVYPLSPIDEAGDDPSGRSSDGPSGRSSDGPSGRSSDGPSGDDQKDLSNLSTDEKKRAKRLFHKHDGDGNGGLDYEEFKQVRSATSRGRRVGSSGVVDGVGGGVYAPSFLAEPALPPPSCTYGRLPCRAGHGRDSGRGSQQQERDTGLRGGRHQRQRQDRLERVPHRPAGAQEVAAEAEAEEAIVEPHRALGSSWPRWRDARWGLHAVRRTSFTPQGDTPRVSARGEVRVPVADGGPPPLPYVKYVSLDAVITELF